MLYSFLRILFIVLWKCSQVLTFVFKVLFLWETWIAYLRTSHLSGSLRKLFFLRYIYIIVFDLHISYVVIRNTNFFGFGYIRYTTID